MERPLLTAGLFFVIAKGYTTYNNLDVPLETQAIVSGVLAVSSVIVERANLEKNPAMKAVTIGSLFSGAMYFGLGDESVMLNAVSGTLTSYAASVILPEEEKPTEVSKEDEWV
jgi:hypothetical protein